MNRTHHAGMTRMAIYRIPMMHHGTTPRKKIRRLARVVIVTLLITASLASADDRNTTISIAAIYAKTGPAAPFGQSSLLGARMAVREINARGGLLGRRLVVTEIDNASTPIGSKVAADKAVADGTTAIIGPAYSTHALAIAKVAQAKQVPMITSIATHPAVTTVGDYIFRVCNNDLIQGETMGRFAREQLKAKWVVIVVDLNSDYSIGMAEAFDKGFTGLGGKVLARLPYKPNQTNFQELITRALSEDPDVVFIPGYFESARIVAQAIRRGLRATPLGGDGWDHDAFFDKGGKQIRHGYFTTHWHRAVDNGRSRQFVKNYGDVELSATAAALAYDAVYLLADAIRRAGSVKRAAIRDALAATRNLPGVTGRLTFNRNGDPVKRVVMMEIRNGQPFYYMQIEPDRADP